MKLQRIFQVVMALLFSAGLAVAGEPSIELLEVTPLPWSTVNETKVLYASLRYDLGDHEFAEGIYSISLQFGTVTEGKTLLPGEPVSAEALSSTLPEQMQGTVILVEPRGEVDIEYALELARWTREIAIPLKINFFLMKKAGDFSTTAIARSEPFEYPVASSW